jgi:hypothetical protein
MMNNGLRIAWSDRANILYEVKAQTSELVVVQSELSHHFFSIPRRYRHAVPHSNGTLLQPTCVRAPLVAAGGLVKFCETPFVARREAIITWLPRRLQDAVNGSVFLVRKVFVVVILVRRFGGTHFWIGRELESARRLGTNKVRGSKVGSVFCPLPLDLGIY